MRDLNQSQERSGHRSVNVVGFHQTEIGLGQHARLLVKSLLSAGIDATAVQSRLVPDARQRANAAYVAPDQALGDISIICINGDGFGEFAREVGDDFFSDRYNIAFWWWEVDPLPDEWLSALDRIDEIWVGSRYVHDLVAPKVNIPVTVIPTPVEFIEAKSLNRESLGIGNSAFVFLYVYSYQSSGRRKNPMDLVEAFRETFGDNRDIQLVLKSVGASHVPDEHEIVKMLAAGADNIVILDNYMDAAQVQQLIASCDCYVSPHRAEGFGYTVAEAMGMGKPVICTNFGGVTDFTDSATAVLLDWTLEIVGAHAFPYPASAVWARPKNGQIGEALEWVYRNQSAAREMGARGRTSVRLSHSPHAVGLAARKRLESIWELREGGDEYAETRNQPWRSSARSLARKSFGRYLRAGIMSPIRRHQGSSEDRAHIERVQLLERRIHRLEERIRSYESDGGYPAGPGPDNA